MYMQEINKNKEKEIKTKNNNKETEYLNFVKYLKTKYVSLEVITENELKKQIVNYFNVEDFRVVNNKINMLVIMSFISKSYDSRGVVYCLLI